MGEEISRILSLGESETVEFKRSISRDAIKAIAAFANGSGGLLSSE